MVACGSDYHGNARYSLECEYLSEEMKNDILNWIWNSNKENNMELKKEKSCGCIIIKDEIDKTTVLYIAKPKIKNNQRIK